MDLLQEIKLEPLLRTVVGVVLFCFLLLIGFPALIILGVVLFLVRQVLTLVKKVLYPTFGKFTGGIGSLFGAEDAYGETETSISSHLIFDGILDLEKLRDSVGARLRSLEKGGIYPEVRQKLSSWAGFTVWIPDTNFRIENHVKVLTSSDLKKYTGYDKVTDENKAQVTRSMLNVPYTRGASPWDFLLCYDVESKTATNPEGATLLLIRTHHVLGDALSIMKLAFYLLDLKNDAKETEEMMEKGEIKLKKSRLETIVYGLTFPVVAAYDLAMFVATATDFNAWHWPSTPIRSQYNYVSFVVNSERIKKIRQLRKTSFFGVLCAAQTGAIRKFMHGRQEAIPKEIHAVVSVPFPSKKQQLSNDITFVALKFPTGENDRRKVLRQVDNAFANAKSSRYPMLMLFAFWVVGMTPRRILSKFRWIFTTCATTNFPGTQTVMQCLGVPCKFVGTLASLPSNVAMYSWALGYNGTTSISIGFSTDVVPDRVSASKMLQILEEEFEGLENPKNDTILRQIPTNFQKIKDN